ncbi:MAG TPA: formate/nitrite transporter family protein [Geminicoccaceae bacterium]|nr:formate/nitrite transporter family protein [Geminicoccaceae bacterium]
MIGVKHQIIDAHRIRLIPKLSERCRRPSAIAPRQRNGGGAVAQTAIGIAQAKIALDFTEAFFRGLCNVLVYLAVWLCFATHDVAGKILAIIFPISAFVALGFEHSVANMYLIPVAMLTGADGVTVAGFLANLVPVTLGNIVGGGVFVALVYWLIYLNEGNWRRSGTGRAKARKCDG